MEIRNLETFIRVAELGSVTKAAQEMGFVQSTVSMQLRQMEEELGYPLFDRIGKRVSLTVLGQEFLHSAYEMVNIMDRAAAKKDIADLQGTLRIGVLESLLFGKLLEVLPRFKERFPKVDLRLKMGQTEELIRQLKQNQLDLVYLSADLNTDRELSCCCHRQERIVFICSPEHPFAGKKVSAAELLGESFVVTERTGVCYGRLQALAAQSNTVVRDFVEVDSTIAITELVRKGMGIGFLPEYAVEKDIRDGLLAKIPADIPEQTYYSQVLSHKKRWLSPLMSGFIEMIVQKEL